MREFLDSILTFILCSTLSDDEWTLISTLNDLSYTLPNYSALLGVLQARDSVSTATDRLAFYFKAAGVDITMASEGKTDIYLGDVIGCN